MVLCQHYCTRCGAANQIQDAFCFACGQSLQATPTSPQYPLAGSATSTFTGLLTPNLLLKQRYRILELVGKGGFAVVYKAQDVQLGNRLLAVKEMSLSSLNRQEIAEAIENFKREALLLATLRHPNLPSIYEQFSEAGRWYFVMDFIEGETLEAYLQNQPGGHLSVEETLKIALQLCTVLSYLHSRQPPIIFRDLKPANIMRTPEGHLYLIDFGIARHFKPGQKRDTIAFGSPGYAAPEQYGKAQTTPRSDIYSLGATLHQVLTGSDPSHTPFQFAPLQLQSQTTPPGLEPLLMQMVDIKESKRPTSMIVVKQELQGIITQQRPPKVAGRDYLQAKRFQEALAAFEQALQLDPTDAVLYNSKGLALASLKRYQEALGAYEQAIVLNFNYAVAYTNRGNVYKELGQYDKALADYSLALALDSKLAVAYNQRGLAYSALRQYDKALADYSQALTLDSKLAVAYSNRGIVHEARQQYDKALADYNQALTLDPKYAVAYRNRGDVYKAQQQYDKAIADYSQALTLNPNYADAYNQRGNVYSALRQYGKALADYSQALTLDSKLAVVYTNRGNVYSALKQYDQAIADYTQALTLDPNYALAYRNRGNVYKVQERYAQALADYNQALTLNPNDTDACYNRGTIYFMQQQYGQAFVDLDRVLQLDPRYSKAQRLRQEASRLLKKK